MTVEDGVERPLAQKRIVAFKGFDPEVPEDEVRATISRIFDHMYIGGINPGFFLDLRDTSVGNVIVSAQVVSERPFLAELTDSERELEELRVKHFEYSHEPASRRLEHPLGALVPSVDTPEFE